VTTSTIEPQVNWKPEMMVEVMLNEPDVQRRNRIARLLSDWGLISVVNSESIVDVAPLNQIKVLAYKDKNDWILEQKYNIGSKKKVETSE
jgi:hypothetical protein